MLSDLSGQVNNGPCPFLKNAYIMYRCSWFDFCLIFPYNITIMKKRWLIKDLINLEYFLNDDEDNDAAHHRDRNIYLEYITPILQKERSASANSRRNIIRHWLDERKRIEFELSGADSVLPGDAFEEVRKLLLYILSVIGFFAGSGLAYSLLAYKGNDALNVSSYLSVLVLTQILLILILIGFFILRRRRHFFKDISIIYSLLSTFLVKLVLRLKKSAIKRLSADQRNHMQAAIGMARGKRVIYGTIFFWPIFILSQVFGIWFNSGVLTATLLRVLSSDLAFGWQSTIHFSSRAVYSIVKIASLPWSWFTPSLIAHPTLEQIEGSRIILKEGIYHLATNDLVSWWPFLCLAVIFYGLLPRIILMNVAFIAQNRALKKLDFTHGSCDKLMGRLQTPVLNTEGLPYEEKFQDVNIDFPQKSNARSFLRGDTVPKNSLIALVPDDIFEQCFEEELRPLIKNTFGFRLYKKIKIGIDLEEDKDVLDTLAVSKWEDGQPNVLILLEAWQPPIKETLHFIREIKKILGIKSKIVISLIGKPETNTIFTNVKENDWKVWDRNIKKFADPYMRMERIEAHESQ